MSNGVPSITKLVEIVQELARHHAETSKDDFTNIEDRMELNDIADDAWNHAGIPDLEYMFADDRDSMFRPLGRAFIHSQIEEHSLNRFYHAEFEQTIIVKFRLSF